MNDVGLCSDCVHCRVITARRSSFYFCERSATDPAFPRYPRLPVRVCVGYQARDDEGPIASRRHHLDDGSPAPTDRPSIAPADPGAGA